MGRPTLLTEELKEQILNSAKIIYHYKWVAASVGIDEKTLQRWREADPDFDGQLDQARSDFIRDNLKRARPDFKLETADHETFGRKEPKTEITVNVVDKLLVAYGIKEGDNDTKTDEAISGSSEKPTRD